MTCDAHRLAQLEKQIDLLRDALQDIRRLCGRTNVMPHDRLSAIHILTTETLEAAKEE